jgi:hypothetical protein
MNGRVTGSVQILRQQTYYCGSNTTFGSFIHLFLWL